MNNEIFISIIIVCHNGQKFLSRLLKSIYNQNYKNYEVILIDTSSTDNSVNWTIQNYNKTKIKIVPNQGYGFACNQGVNISNGKYLIFLNEDMYLPHDFLLELINFINNINKKNKIGAIGTKIIDFGKLPEKYPDNIGGQIDIFGFPQENKNPNKILSVNGCLFFIKKSTFIKIGKFNENIKFYNEDIDLSLRLVLFGYTNYMNNNTWLFHYGGGVMGNNNNAFKIANVVANTLIVIYTNYRLSTFIIVFPFYLLNTLIVSIYLLIKHKFSLKYQIALFNKYLEIIKQHKRINKFRKFVQKGRKLNENKLLSYISPYPSLMYNFIIKK